MPPVEPVPDDQHLAKTLSVGQAIGLGITIVVGSGLLVLPGLAYREVGDAAIWAWVGDALLVLPLLVVFGYLGSRYPSAGGIAGFVQAGFGRTGAAATEVLLIGTFVFVIGSAGSGLAQANWWLISARGCWRRLLAWAHPNGVGDTMWASDNEGFHAVLEI